MRHAWGGVLALLLALPALAQESGESGESETSGASGASDAAASPDGRAAPEEAGEEAPGDPSEPEEPVPPGEAAREEPDPSPKDAIVQGEDEAQGEAPQWGRGPFEVADPYVLAFHRMRTWATTPEVLGHLRGSVQLRTVWANSYAFETNRMVIDAETREVDLSLRLGILDRFQAGVHVGYLWRGGGTMDGFLEGFHKAFGLPNGQRQLRPRDRYRVEAVEADGTTYRLDHAGYGFNDLVLEGRALLTRGGHLLPALTGTLRVRLPTGRGKFDFSDGLDFSLGVDASKRLGSLPFVLYSGVSYSYHAEARVDDLELARHQGVVYVGVEWEILPTLSFVAHTWIASRRETILWKNRAGVTDNDLAFGNWITYVAGGLKFEPLQGLTFELGAIENIIDPETTSDFGLLFNVTLEL